MLTYVAQIEWTWDKRHTDFATISIEEYNLDGAVVKGLEDPDCPEPHRKFYFERFEKIAELQNGCPMGPARLRAIYRVDDIADNNLANDGPKMLIFRMRPVFRFDENGKNPVPVS